MQEREDLVGWATEAETRDAVRDLQGENAPPKRHPRWRWLTLYAVSRHFGGPEEGGWWYDWWTPRVSWQVPGNLTAEQEAKVRALMQELFGWPSGPQGRFSVRGEPDAKLVLEDVQYADQSTIVPHYE